jgi:FkbM family methyltransferase
LDVLPEHMVPALNAFATLSKLPLTPTGKVDVSALKPPAESDLESGLSHAPTRNEIESVVAEIWKRELGLDRVGIHDDFIEVGGHSLLAIRIVSQLNERFGVSLPLRSLLRGGTVATIARRLTDLNAIEPIEEDLVRCPLPDGQVIVAPFAAEAQYLWEDVFAENTYGPPVRYEKNAVVVDVGANIGLYTLYALAASPLGRVIAIEPVPILFEALKRNTVEYAKRVTYYLTAAGDNDADATLTYYPKLSGMSSLRADPEADGALLRRIVSNLLGRRAETDSLLKEIDEIVSERFASQTLPCAVRRLEGILNDAAPDRIDVLKIDVQRYEEQVLSGVGNAWPRVRQVVVEVHDENGALKRIDCFLRDLGFSTTARQQAIHAGTPVHFIVGQR